MGIFDYLSDSIIRSVTHLINAYSGFFQIAVYLVLAFTFGFAIVKCMKALRILARADASNFRERDLLRDSHGPGTPIAVVSASFFLKTKRHYAERTMIHAADSVPPDVYITDAAFQYTERFFQEKYLEPVSMTANLLPPIGFIGTIIGMTIHFINETGTINANATAAGIATALYTTLLALVGFTCIEFFKKALYMLAQKRIDEGLETCVSIFAEDDADNVAYLERMGTLGT